MTTKTKPADADASLVFGGQYDWTVRPIVDGFELLHCLRRTHASMCWGFHGPIRGEYAVRFSVINNRIKRDDGKIEVRKASWVYLTVDGKDEFVITITPKNSKRIVRQVHDVNLDGLLNHLDLVLEYQK